MVSVRGHRRLDLYSIEHDGMLVLSGRLRVSDPLTDIAHRLPVMFIGRRVDNRIPCTSIAQTSLKPSTVLGLSRTGPTGDRRRGGRP